MSEPDRKGPPLRGRRFTVLGGLRSLETIARGGGIREIGRLRRAYGAGNWRKRKGCADVQLPNGMTRRAEVHWYEAHGKGRVELRIKRYLE